MIVTSRLTLSIASAKTVLFFVFISTGVLLGEVFPLPEHGQHAFSNELTIQPVQGDACCHPVNSNHFVRIPIKLEFFSGKGHDPQDDLIELVDQEVALSGLKLSLFYQFYFLYCAEEDESELA